MKHIIKLIFFLICILTPLSGLALEPIFNLKGKSIILLNSTKDVAYTAIAVANNDFSKKNLADSDFKNKEILVTNVNIINWDKKNQSVIFEFRCDGNEYCMLFPQNIKTSYVGKKPYTRFYTGKYMDMYQNHDDSHYVEPKKICLTYWLKSDVDFIISKIGSKFKWKRDDKKTYLLLSFDFKDGKLTYREYQENEVKASNSTFTELKPFSTVSSYNVFDNRKEAGQLFQSIDWID